MSSNNAAGRGIDDKRRRDGISVSSEIEKKFHFLRKIHRKWNTAEEYLTNLSSVKIDDAYRDRTQ